MAADRIEELKSVRFPTERRDGYDKRAVDAYLAELADWLGSGGADEARRSVIQGEIGRIGERAAAILAAAQSEADELAAEAGAEAERVRSDAAREAAEARTSADAYAKETRVAADEHARTTAEETARQRTEAEAEIEARRRRSEEEATARTRGIEQEIADLVRKRRDVVANLEQLNAEMKLAIQGPGERDLELPDRVEAAVESPRVLEPESEHETEILVSAESDEDRGDERDERDEGDRVEASRRAELERRRRSVDPVDPPTDDQKLTELL